MHPKVLLIKQILAEKKITNSHLAELAAPENAVEVRKQIEKLLYWTDFDTSLADLCLQAAGADSRRLEFVRQLSTPYEAESELNTKFKKLKSFLLDLSEKALSFKPHLVKVKSYEIANPFTPQSDSHYIPLSGLLRSLSFEEQIASITRVIRNISSKKSDEIFFTWYRTLNELVIFNSEGILLERRNYISDSNMFDEESENFLKLSFLNTTEAA
ncbi:MAG: hypothetical protein AMXMBFR48_14660 [Ignavibacteriales bacterium]